MSNEVTRLTEQIEQITAQLSSLSLSDFNSVIDYVKEGEEGYDECDGLIGVIHQDISKDVFIRYGLNKSVH